MASPRYLITGASRGVGLALITALTGRGNQVVGCSRTGSPLVASGYDDVLLDVTDQASVSSVFAALRESEMLPDVVVLGAGATAASPIMFQDSVVFEDVLRTNILGAFLVAREALRGMMRSGFGRIIFVSSINTRLHSAGGVAYNASKRGLEEMAATFAGECGAGDITVNTLGLSLVEGEGMAAGLTAAETSRKSDRLVKSAPVSMVELVHAIDFLSAPAARSITGQVIFFGGVS